MSARCPLCVSVMHSGLDMLSLRFSESSAYSGEVDTGSPTRICAKQLVSASRPDADDVGHALGARTMPPHLHTRADPDVRPRALRPTGHEPGLVGDVVCPRPAPADSREGAGRVIARGHGAAPSGRPMIDVAADADATASVAATTHPR